MSVANCACRRAWMTFVCRGPGVLKLYASDPAMVPAHNVPTVFNLFLRTHSPTLLSASAMDCRGEPRKRRTDVVYL